MGVGLWWPNRSYITQPLTDLEKDFVEHETEQIDGVKMWGSMKGHRGSSTRAEIAAIILALLSDVPINIATDSANAKNGLDKLITYMKEEAEQNESEWHYEEWPMGKHWSFVHDGDLWEQVWTQLHQKGHHAVAATKVKCHAKEDDVKGNEELETIKLVMILPMEQLTTESMHMGLACRILRSI